MMRTLAAALICAALTGSAAFAWNTTPIPDAHLINAVEQTKICRCPVEGFRVDNAACGMPQVTYDRAHVAPWISVSQLADWMGLSCAKPSMTPNEQLNNCSIVDERLRRMYEHPVNWIVAAPAVSGYLYTSRWNWQSSVRTPGIPDETFGLCPTAAGDDGTLELLPSVHGDMARAALFLFDRYNVDLPPLVEAELIELTRKDPVSAAEVVPERQREQLNREYNLYVLDEREFDQTRNLMRLNGILKAYKEVLLK